MYSRWSMGGMPGFMLGMYPMFARGEQMESESQGEKHDYFYAILVGKLMIETARLQESLLATEITWRKRTEQAIRDSLVEVEKIRAKLQDARIEIDKQDSTRAEIQRKLEFAHGLLFTKGDDLEALWLEYKNKPTDRELAMARTKGEFEMACSRYADRVGVNRDQAKETLKKELGLTGLPEVVSDLKDKKARTRA